MIGSYCKLAGPLDGGRAWPQKHTYVLAYNVPPLLELPVCRHDCAVTAGRLVTEFLGGGFVGGNKADQAWRVGLDFSTKRFHADEQLGVVRSPHTHCTREKLCSGESATPIALVSGG